MRRLFAIGDIHGCYDQFRTIIEEKIKAVPDDKIILIGDYIDRGARIREVIDYIIDLRLKGFDIVTLRGNHEVMMLDAIKSNDMSLWLWNGATQTLDSFGIDTIEQLDEKYRQFFEELLWYYEYGDCLFVHAGFNDKAPFDDKTAMVWTRNEVYKNPLLTDRIIVHGHTPIFRERCIKNVRSKSHVINIDTGCVYPEPGFGNLTAIELNTRELYFS